jgi:hypothetical protein
MDRRRLREKLVPGFRVWSYLTPREWRDHGLDRLGVPYSRGHNHRRYVRGLIVERQSDSEWLVDLGGREILVSWNRVIK